ncbi:regulatory protein RecX [Snuella lapsa]|uniref:Regulatory protein RecX n=1 Tax=Snuella lapsa TaxID=870481 RepID=A0ABP6WZM2_9FLAO
MQHRKIYTLEEAIKKMEHYCAYQERCHKEVRQKLTGMRMIPEAIDHIVVHLIEQNFLNEERYAKAYVQGKFQIKKWGKQRLILELKHKDISKRNIDIAIGELDEETYLTTFNNLAKRRVLSIKEANVLKKKKKLADYLLYRGWESYLVYDKVAELVK